MAAEAKASAHSGVTPTDCVEKKKLLREKGCALHLRLITIINEAQARQNLKDRLAASWDGP